MEIKEKTKFEYKGFVFEIIKFENKTSLFIKVPINLKDYIEKVNHKFVQIYGDEYFLSEEFFRNSSTELFPHRTNLDNMKQYVKLLFSNYLD